MINGYIIIEMRNSIKFIGSLMMLLLVVTSVKAQQGWEPQKRITGYISSEIDAYSELEGYDNSYGVSLSEAGILASYQPKENLTFKAVFVYRPDFSFNQMLNEANVQYKYSDLVNFKVGRFLTPLSPMNTYYYAPVNTSATLPVLISNHEFFPLNMDALSIAGHTGFDFRLSYEVFVGGYRNTTWMRTGAVGFFGDEVAYYKKKINSEYTIDESFNNTSNVALGGNVHLSYQDYVTVGLNVFKPRNENMAVFIPAINLTRTLKKEMLAYGVDFKLSLNNTIVMGEVWNSDFSMNGTSVDLNGAFIEISQCINKFTPYVRYEDQTTNDISFKRYTAGMMFKPTFETTFKLEYLKYDHKVEDVDGLVLSLIYSF